MTPLKADILRRASGAAAAAGCCWPSRYPEPCWWLVAQGAWIVDPRVEKGDGNLARKSTAGSFGVRVVLEDVDMLMFCAGRAQVELTIEKEDGSLAYVTNAGGGPQSQVRSCGTCHVTGL